ncbi:MAG: 4Fe-4S dicluster domain-containing protein [Candidatus Thermoplasmatota archaeon]|nr:4Fe-4S dicluster domain-containing protein [Candidatus Thermoplasmatota archaeon]
MKYLYAYPERCTGCKECAIACSLKKFGECNPKKSAISIVRDEFERYEFPIVCLQCDEAMCMTICPQNAIYKEKNIIKINKDKCTRCRLCVAMCPYSAITVLGDEIIQCDLCDGEPTCVKFCPTNAIEYLEETAELAKRRKELVKKLSLK